MPRKQRRKESTVAETTPNGKPNIFPALRYQDASAAIDWLDRAFGFEKHTVVSNPDGTVAHAELRFGSGMIMLGQSRDNDLRLKSPRDVNAVTQSLYVYVEDVDAHYKRAIAAGAEPVRDLSDTDYGSREYSALDP